MIGKVIEGKTPGVLGEEEEFIFRRRVTRLSSRLQGRNGSVLKTCQLLLRRKNQERGKGE